MRPFALIVVLVISQKLIKQGSSKSGVLMGLFAIRLLLAASDFGSQGFPWPAHDLVDWLDNLTIISINLAFWTRGRVNIYKNAFASHF